QTVVAMALAFIVIVPIAAMAPAAEVMGGAWTSTEAVEGIDLAAPEAPAATGLAKTVSRGMLPSVAARRPHVSIPDTIDTRKRKVVDAFIGALGDEDEQIRRQAAHMLGEIEDERAIPALREALKNDSSREVRRAALWALSEMDSQDIMPVLLDLAADETDAEARRQLAWMIGENADHGDSRAGEVLTRLLKDSDAEVRATAVWGLAEMEYTPALNAIVAMTEDNNDEVRERAVWAVSELAEDAPTDEAVAALTRAMGSGNAGVRETAAWALGEIEDPRAVKVLTKALKDGDREVRRRAAHALHEIDTEASHRALSAAIGDSDVNVRRMAMEALGELEDPESIGVLEEAARDSDQSVRHAAIHALSDMEDQRAAAALIRGLEDASPEIRKYSAHGLGELESTPAMTNGLRRALGDESAEVRRAVIHTLAELEDLASAEALIDALSDDSAANRRAAAWAVAELLEDSPTDKGLDALATMLRNDTSAENRKAAAYALGEMGSGRAIDVLRAALDDGDRDVRRAAASALSDIDWDEETTNQGQDDDWNDDLSNYQGIRIDLSDQQVSRVGQALGMAVGDITEIALDAAGMAIESIDLGSIFHSIRHDLGSIDVDAMVDEFEAGVEGLDAEIEIQIRGAMISGLATLAIEHPGTGDSKAAIRALKRMDHRDARRALRKIDDCGC
ncbi:MAG: HEAT repeat protein, partial [Rhodothermales bacterium]